MGDGRRSSLDNDRGSVHDRSVDGLKNNRGSMHYGSVNSVNDGRSMNDRSVDSVDNRRAMVNDLRRLCNGGLGCDYRNSVGVDDRGCVDYWGCVDCGHEGG